MMEIINHIKHSFHNVRHYRALWIFGVIIALTTSFWSPLYFLGHEDDDDHKNSKSTVEFILPSSSRVILPTTIRLDDEHPVDRVVIYYQGKIPDYIPSNGDLIIVYGSNKNIAFNYFKLYPSGSLQLERNVIPEEFLRIGILILIGLTFFGLALWILALSGRYISSTALIQMVYVEAENGVRLSARQGFRHGLSKSALRLFLIDIVINTLAVMAFVLLFALVALPFALAAPAGEPAIFAGIMISSSLFFLALLSLIIGSALIALTRVFVWRACVLERLGVSASLRRGVEILVTDLPQTGLVWFVTFGLRIIYPLILIPIALILVSVGLLVGGVPAILIGGLTTAANAGSDVGVLFAIIVGMGLFLLTLVAPLVLLNGLLEVFSSSLWTLTYRYVSSNRAQREPAAGLALAEPTPAT